MCLGEILVLAYEDDDRVPEFKRLRLVLFETLSYDFRFADVGLRVSCVRIGAKKEVDASTLKFLPGKKVVKFRSRRGECFPVQLETSPTRRRLASPWGRNSLIVAEVMRRTFFFVIYARGVRRGLTFELSGRHRVGAWPAKRMMT